MAAEVLVEPQPDGTFLVQVRQGKTTTTHVVSVPEGMGADVQSEHVPDADIVRASFDFLLEREPATSILRQFRLSQISDYFPEYPAEIRRRLER